MSMKELLTGGTGLILALMTLVQIIPIKVNPWSALAKIIGRAINADVLKEFAEVKAGQKEIQACLDAHIRTDDERNADSHRDAILRFNMELVQNIKHTREDYIEILEKIDFYQQYCKTHEDYENGRAVHAIANVERTYDERLQKRDFL